MISPNLITDNLLQVGDMARLDASQSLVSGLDQFVSIEIQPDAEDDFVLLDKDYPFLDYYYETVGDKVCTVRLTSDLGTKEVSKTISVISEEDDRLFSNDSMLADYEQNIFGLLPSGRQSFKYAHRKSQEDILRDLIESGHKVDKVVIFDIKEVQRWSTFKTLALIFESNVMIEGDVHIRKTEIYQIKESEARNSALIRFDNNKDGIADTVIRNFPSRIRLT